MKNSIKKLLNIRDIFPSNDECESLLVKWKKFLKEKENLSIVVNYEQFPNYVKVKSDVDD